MDKEQFKMGVIAKKESEWLIPFIDFDAEFPPYVDPALSNPDREEAKGNLQRTVVSWCEEIPGCNWSVGFVDDAEQNVLVVKWWFNDEDYPVKGSEE